MCDHKKIEIHYRLVAQATRYEPAEYEQWAECDECGEMFDPDDVPDAEVTGSKQIKRVKGVPHEYYD